ncbi:DUF4391 domain-containing protein [Corynebacterium terpenotabidum]|uniref:DUF4391 domain-containing protein n=1 Tax=Corynebacterium terpenotabidum Y-11 TaxID=1200352 RepID=S4XMB6_9CORY|nr:DUF4391 domain-containing protein [Corynebacterium terpenotabidum]AGP31778.1 hypothetical protein A606_10695 [Corynebacterium terpenotabidum Y-11]
MTDLLYRWPTAAEFARRIPKDKFYGRGRDRAAVKEKFVAEVDRITWAYKLAEVTVNLPDSDAVPEVQVFEVVAKEDDISDQVLRAMDTAVLSPIIFEVMRDHGDRREVRMVAAHKKLGSGAPTLSGYFSTGWMPSEAERSPLPAAVSLEALYEALLEPLTRVTVRAEDSVAEVSDRLNQVGKLEREVAALERKIRTEKQFNRKVELRRNLKIKQQELESQR